MKAWNTGAGKGENVDAWNTGAGKGENVDAWNTGAGKCENVDAWNMRVVEAWNTVRPQTVIPAKAGIQGDKNTVYHIILMYDTSALVSSLRWNDGGRYWRMVVLDSSLRWNDGGGRLGKELTTMGGRENWYFSITY